MLSVREIQHSDIELITQYWVTAEPGYLMQMGVDVSKVPNKDQWIKILTEQLDQSPEEKQSYCIIWQLDNKPIGHSNINKILPGKEAYMHLHIWYAEVRKKGLGTAFIRMTLPYYFENYHLQTLYCEPRSLNEAPNNVLEKAGFTFVRDYVTIPGWLNFEQEVSLWEMNYDTFISMNLST